MTALKKYQRLEASGLWRRKAEDQRREVVVSVGEATLTISDLNDRPLAHWSLAAIERVNTGERPAIYCPDGDPAETLELAEDEDQMIDAIERLRRAVERTRAKPGRLRLASVLAVVAAILALMMLWLPDAVTRQAISVVPVVKRQDIGQQLLHRIERISGPACETAGTRRILARLAGRTGVRQIVVVPGVVPDSLGLPGGIVVVNKALVESYEDPAVAVGYILREQARARLADPLAALLSDAGPIASFRLLTTGEVTEATLDHYAETLLTTPLDEIPDAPLLQAFADAKVSSAPFAYTVDSTGETVLSLIEADPMAGTGLPPPILPDRDWVLLQSICGG